MLLFSGLLDDCFDFQGKMLIFGWAVKIFADTGSAGFLFPHLYVNFMQT